MSDFLVRLEQVSKTYGSGDAAVHALKDVSFTLCSRERVMVIGPSGSGKTTFLSVLGCLLKVSSGGVFIRGEDVTRKSEADLAVTRAAHFGFVFQDPHLFDALNAVENVALILQLKNGNASNPYQDALKLLERVRVSHRMKARPAELSGGERQRIAIARALAGNPKIILADEPTASLDTQTAMAIMGLLDEIGSQEGHALVVVTHDVRLEKFADRTVKIRDGEMVKEAS